MVFPEDPVFVSGAGDVIVNVDSNETGEGDFVLVTRGEERGRVENDGTGTGVFAGGGGGVTEITSEDESVTITNPTGPTVDLSVSGGGSQPVEGSYTGVPVTVADDANASLPFSLLVSGTDLLDRTDPDNPVLLADGTYALTLFGTVSALSPGGSWSLSTSIGLRGVSERSTFASQSLSMTLEGAAGDVVAATVSNSDGAASRDFTLVTAILVKQGDLTVGTLAEVLAQDNDADGLKITNLDDPALDQDAATKKYVDDNAGGGTLAQVLAAGNDADGLKIANLDDPALDQDAATKKYVDDNAGGGGGNVDGGTASSVYTVGQHIDGGSA